MCASNNSNNYTGGAQDLATKLSTLLHKILSFHEVDGLVQMVLHELGHKDSFNFSKAIYLVDNPDFDHLQGVAGYSYDECHFHKDNLWQAPDSFLKDMHDADYHHKIQDFLHSSLKRKDIDMNSSKEIHELGESLGLSKPEFFSWNMKYGNHGLLLFERNDSIEDPDTLSWKNSFLRNVAALLSFCGF